MTSSRISDLIAGTTPIAAPSLLELSIPSGASPSGFESRSYTYGNFWNAIPVSLSVSDQRPTDDVGASFYTHNAYVNGGIFGFNLYYGTAGGSGLKRLNTNPGGYLSIETGTGDLHYSTTPTGAVGSAATVTSVLKVTPQGAVTANGAINSLGLVSSFGNTGGLAFEQRDVPSSNWLLYGSGGTARLNTGGSDKLTIGTNGNVGIVNTVAAMVDNYPLSVTAPSGSDCWMRLNTTRIWGVGVRATAGFLGTFAVSDYTAGAARLMIDPAGACSASSTWAVISDIRLKQDVSPYQRGLSDILKLDPIAYRWNGKGGVPDDGIWHYGLSAQQVEESMPELVREMEHADGDEAMILKSYSPTDLTFALLNAIKELHAEIEDLKAKLQSLTQ